jgi:lipopolysaccharide export system protein LptA
MLRGFLVYLTSCFLCICFSQAQMVPSGEVLDFRLPRFSDKGYPQWILRGGKGIHDSSEQIRVEDMSLRVYSGDELKALEMTIDSPEATLLVKENIGVSNSTINIVGSNFKVSGEGWTWNGTKKEIEVKSKVVVEFSQEVAGMLSGRVLPKQEGDRLTEIFSHSLSLKTTPEAYIFKFVDSVNVVSGDTELKSELLVAIADTTKGEGSEDASMAELEFDSIDKIIATDQVVISQAGHVLKAERAEFSLREQSAEFKGSPSIETSGAYLSGSTIRSEKGSVVVNGSSESGRAQMIVYQAGGLGISKDISLSEETVVLADTIKMQEFESGNQFNFEGSVEVMSGSMLVRTDSLTLYLEPTTGDESVNIQSDLSEDDTNANLHLGEVVRVTGEGSVYIEQENQVATCDRVVFYPREKHAVLSGDPKVEHEQATITGHTMELKQGLAIVNGSADQLAQVILPQLPDMGVENLQLMEGMQTSEPEETEIEETEVGETGTVAIETIVKAKTLHITENPDHFLINFTDSVSVKGTNLKAFCSRLDVIIVEEKQEDGLDGRGQMQVQTINAYEDVVFEQIGRKATADKATIRPVEGEIVLEGNVVITDDRGKVSGHRIRMHKGDGRAIVEGDGTEGSRARITFPEMDFPGEE